MRWLFLLALGLAALGQTVPTRISPDEAAKHSIQRVPAVYPQLAAVARIQGTVIVEIKISESGAASYSRIVSGHPMLVQAAIDAVNNWKYQPFEVDGKPAPVVTLAMVIFGNTANQSAEGRDEMFFQHNFWTAVESAQAAITKGEFAIGQENLNKASALILPDEKGLRHSVERWQWMTTMGHLFMAQQKYDEAEQHYKKALALSEQRDRDTPQVALGLANLGTLFAERKQLDVSRDYFARSLAIYQKNLKRVGSGNPGAREAYARAIAFESFSLLKFASQRNDRSDLDKQCHTVSEFQSFLSAPEHDTFAAACEAKR